MRYSLDTVDDLSIVGSIRAYANRYVHYTCWYPSNAHLASRLIKGTKVFMDRRSGVCITPLQGHSNPSEDGSISHMVVIYSLCRTLTLI